MTPRPVLAQGPPLPTPQIMSQWWRDICFAHWSIDPARIAPMLPRGVRPDLHDGRAWVGLIPFRMVDAGVLTGPPVPWLGTFLEMNVRTYTVDDHGRHGVYFCSLEAQRLAVVAGALGSFDVPYRWARMTYEQQPYGAAPVGPGSTLTYTSRRIGPRLGAGSGRVRGSAAHSRMSVAVGDSVPEPSELDLFLTARFGLHTSLLAQPLWVPNTHGPWPLHRAELLDLDDTLLAAAGFPDLAATPPQSVLCSPTGVRTTFGLPQRVR
ncbi:DUF2071 domain-containing protein [Dermatophilaceae bacterium Soc4.6]